MAGRNLSINPGISAVLGAALRFGASTPLAKLLLQDLGPWMLAGLFYFGSGIGLMVVGLIRRAKPVRMERAETAWLVGAIRTGGVVGPVLLMFGLTAMPASAASLLLNAEGVFTALLAWIAFKENFDRRIALGMLAIASGAIVLSWPENHPGFAGLWPALAVLGACLAWGVDNNLTRKVSLVDATWIAAVKGTVAGGINLALAFIVGERLPDLLAAMEAMTVGFLAYGVSLALFVVGLRHHGTARTGAYFSVAPFVGAMLALASGEPLTIRVAAAGALMTAGVWLHLTEHHDHTHIHKATEHTHEHVHDAHHQHAHKLPFASGVRHEHRHRHDPQEHAHVHFPDAHHQGHTH